MSVVIRRATPDDAEVVHGLIHSLAEYERLTDDVRSSPESIRRALSKTTPRSEPIVHVFLAEDQGRAVGFALYFLTFSTFEGASTLYLEDLFVEPEQRGRGIGKGLLARLASEARAAGCKRMEWAALDWNTSARDFYEKLGAHPMTEWITYRLDAVRIDILAGQADSSSRFGS